MIKAKEDRKTCEDGNIGLRIKETERNLSFDILKTLAIFLVITYHFKWMNLNILSNTTESFVNYYILSFIGCHVPLFFAINGALLFNKPLDLRKHMKKTIRLIFLTIVWSGVTIWIMSLIMDSPITLRDFFVQLNTGENGWNSHLWFLEQLCVIYILFPLFKTAYDTPQNKYLIAFVVIAGA